MYIYIYVYISSASPSLCRSSCLGQELTLPMCVIRMPCPRRTSSAAPRFALSSSARPSTPPRRANSSRQ